LYCRKADANLLVLTFIYEIIIIIITTTTTTTTTTTMAKPSKKNVNSLSLNNFGASVFVRP
jgi:hypothetical protein